MSFFCNFNAHSVQCFRSTGEFKNKNKRNQNNYATRSGYRMVTKSWLPDRKRNRVVDHVCKMDNLL